MNKTITSRKTDPQLEKLGIYGFSGSYLEQNLFTKKYHSVLIENTDWKAFLFYKPAETNYHLPQDSLGITFRDEQILFAIADGVSIVGGTNDNLSGHVSSDLMKASLVEENEIPYESIGQEYAGKRLRGASTLQFGKMSVSKLEAHFLGSLENLGSSYYEDKQHKLTNFIADGKDFFPQTWEATQIVINNAGLNGIISSSDGARISESEASKLLLAMKTKSTEERIEEDIIKVIPYSPDDQSVVLIIKR